MSSKVIYKTPFIKVVEADVIKPNGQGTIFSYVETPDQSVFIVPLTDNNEVYLINQVRYPTMIASWELPGGNCDGDDVIAAAKRELQEETGLRAKKWTKVGWFIAMNGVCAEVTNVLVAKELTQTADDKRDEEGITKIKKVKFDRVLVMIEKGEITDGQTIAAVAKAQLYLKSS